jgi:NAD(P)-dependent dehydrogenase (short-subunit alcohol dehydrogenase family)
MSPSSKGTIIVTGPAGGIGGGWVFEHLKSPQAKLYHTIYLIHPHAPGNLKEAIEKHAPEGHSYEIIPVDLSSQSSIRAFAKDVNSRISSGEIRRIRLLLLIAGAMFKNKNNSDGLSFTNDGIESTFAVNYLSNFLLVLLLLQGMDREWARVVWIASYSHDTHLLISRKTFPTEEERVVFKGEGRGDVERLARQTVAIKKGDGLPASLRRYVRIESLCLVALVMHSHDSGNISCGS